MPKYNLLEQFEKTTEAVEQIDAIFPERVLVDQEFMVALHSMMDIFRKENLNPTDFFELINILKAFR